MADAFCLNILSSKREKKGSEGSQGERKEQQYKKKGVEEQMLLLKAMQY